MRASLSILTLSILTRSVFVGIFALLSGIDRASAQASRPAKEEKPPSPLEVAAAALRAEGEAFVEDPAAHALRTESDYFAQESAAGIDQKQVIAALKRAYSKRSPTVDAYVKWQLLSAVPKTFDAGHASAAVDLYRSAPGPLPFPGLGEKNQRELAGLAAGAAESDLPALSAKWQQAVTASQAANAPIFGYRDALLAKLPPSGPAVAAGLEDAGLRASLGHDPKAAMKAVAAVARGWAASPDADPRHVRAVADALRRLSKDAELDKGPKVYTEPEWREKSKSVAWKTRVRDLGAPGELATLADQLESAAANAEGGGFQAKP